MALQPSSSLLGLHARRVTQLVVVATSWVARLLAYAAFVACSALVACSASDGTPSDALTPDAGTPDAGDGSGAGGAASDGGAIGAMDGSASMPDGSTSMPDGTPLPIPDFDCPRFVTGVIASDFGDGSTVGQSPPSFPDNVLGPPSGAGCCAGTTDVASLGNGGSIVVAFDGTEIVDGAGPDFTVFENAFAIGGDVENKFVELATVAVSEDGETWTEFPCEASTAPYDSCAGTEPGLGNYAKGIDPLDPSVSGGDQFDLADIGVPRARYVRITDRADLAESLDCCFDLDAVAVLNAVCTVAAE